MHGAIALVHCTPLTGKTHQIRIHLAHSGHPVVGDKIYGPSEECYLEFIETGWSDHLQKRLWHPRHALHSCSLSLTIDGVLHHWEAPLSDDLKRFLSGG
jgi:23S rRNA pseudouridine1911/1915/1917 synthase